MSANMSQGSIDTANTLPVEPQAQPNFQRALPLRIVGLVIGALISFGLFVLLGWFVHKHQILGGDLAITRWCLDHKTRWLTNVALIVSYIGSNVLLFNILAILTGLAFALIRCYLEGILLIVSHFASAWLNGTAKKIVGRIRPHDYLTHHAAHTSLRSFPSEHQMSYLAFWGLLFLLGCILLKKDRWWHYTLLVLSLLFVILIGPARVYLGLHWATDILGSYLFGGAFLCLLLSLYLPLKARGVLTRKA